MADFQKSMDILMELEFSNPGNALHKNPTEGRYTYMGIYQKAWPKWTGWMIVNDILKKNTTTEGASRDCAKNDTLTKLVYVFYKRVFWDIARLDDVVSQKIADEIFIFGVNAGMPTAVKTAQKIVGVFQDGAAGPMTIEALNEFDEEIFDAKYDLSEQEYYKKLIDRNPKLKIYANGWRNRSIAV